MGWPGHLHSEPVASGSDGLKYVRLDEINDRPGNMNHRHTVSSYPDIRQTGFSGETSIGVSEESFTDINLVDLRNKHPNQIQVDKHSKARESTTGADWDWWIGGKPGWIHMRVQAKKLDTPSLTYKKLDYSNTNGKQVDLLIGSSSQQGGEAIPLYVLYNYWNYYLTHVPWNCSCYGRDIQLMGCSIVHASIIKNALNKNNKTLAALQNNMFPWSCLVCCQQPAYGYPIQQAPGHLAQRVLSAINKHLDLELADEYSAPKVISESLPDYVAKVTKGQELGESEWEYVDAKAIMVIRDDE